MRCAHAARDSGSAETKSEVLGDAQTYETRVTAFDGRGCRIGGGLSDHGRAGDAGNGRRPRGGSGLAAPLGHGRKRRYSGRRPLGSGRGVGDVQGWLALHGAVAAPYAVNHAPPNDVTEGYAADWTAGQLRESAQRVANRVEELMGEEGAGVIR